MTKAKKVLLPVLALAFAPPAFATGCPVPEGAQYVSAAEVAKKKRNKCKGSKPDLCAYWMRVENFLYENDDAIDSSAAYSHAHDANVRTLHIFWRVYNTVSEMESCRSRAVADVPANDGQVRAAQTALPTVTVHPPPARGREIGEGATDRFGMNISEIVTTDVIVPIDVVQSGDFLYLDPRFPADFLTSMRTDNQGTREHNLKNVRSLLSIFRTVNDSDDEPDGSLTMTIQSGSTYELGPYTSATWMVIDDDPTAVTLSAPSGDIAEAGMKELTVTLGRALVAGEILEVPLAFGGVAALGSDYSLSAPNPPASGVTYVNLSSTPTVTFTGPSAAAAAVIVEATADGMNEGAGESVTVDLSTLSATGLGGGAQ
ncbi:MAG: hypothetical protein OXG51_03305, partial [Gammaproteobacteria bacterium]|nr:hypothetical protein [Gammaproteobacteria bacterium]